MNKEKLFPITYEGFNAGHAEFSITFYNVTFLESFGIFSKGTFLKSMNIYYRDGRIEGYYRDNARVEMEFRIIESEY